MIEVREARAEVRFNGKCRACGAKRSALARSVDVYDASRREGQRVVRGFLRADGVYREPWCPGDVTTYREPCSCGQRIVAMIEVVGKVRADKGCDHRCMSATGHTCECSCGGRNHGAAHG